MALRGCVRVVRGGWTLEWSSMDFAKRKGHLGPANPLELCLRTETVRELYEELRLICSCLQSN